MRLTEVSRGISHIEDIPADEIIEILINLPNFQITEKVDGAQILFGIDENGFYTSRETKGGIRIYNEGDYGITFSSTYMRSTHKLLEQMLPVLRGAGLRPGDQVEAEVLYGELPNVVPYSADTNYLIFLRTTEGAVNIDRLKQKLDGQAVSVSLVSPFTDDGKSIVLREETNIWKFARVPIIEKKYDSRLIRQYVSEMKKYLNIVDSTCKQTLGVILETPLNKIPEWVESGTWKQTKEYLKERKLEISQELETKHILPLKEVLLNNFVRNTSSIFGPLVEEGGWIEGVVLRNEITGRMVKLVDKDVFGKVRESAWAYRNRISESAKGIDGDHSFLASTYISMATAIGHPELGTIQAKNYLRKAGSINEERITNISANVDFTNVRNYWLHLLEQREELLIKELDKYEKETAASTGGDRHRVFENAIKQRTLQTFAQAFERIYDLQEASLQAQSKEDLLRVLVGKQLGELDMRLDEVVTLNDVLNSDSFIKLLNSIQAKPQDLNITRIKNQVLQSWKKGMRSRKHYDDLLSQIDISLNQLIDK